MRDRLRNFKKHLITAGWVCEQFDWEYVVAFFLLQLVRLLWHINKLKLGYVFVWSIVHAIALKICFSTFYLLVWLCAGGAKCRVLVKPISFYARMRSCSIKPGFHTCVSRTHNNARCLTMYGHQWSQSIPAFATKACEVATKSHVLNFCEGLRGLCRDVLWLWSIETNNARNKKSFLSSEKKGQSQKQQK